MENYIKTNLQGEILIPLENSYKIDKVNNPNKVPFSKIFDLDYKSFRSTVFKNEFIHFYLIIQLTPEENSGISTSKNYSMNINKLNDYISNNCSINIQYSKVYIEKEDEDEKKIEIKEKQNKEDLTYSFEESKEMKYVNNGILINKEVLIDKNIIVYELYSKIKLKNENNKHLSNTNILMNITITTNENNNSYNDLDINDIHIISYLNLFDNENKIGKKCTLLNINKKLSVVNPLNIKHMNQYGGGNNKYIISVKIENATYKINFLDESLKNSIFLKKQIIPINEFLYYEFPIIITDTYINGDKTLIEDLIFISFLKFEQEKKSDDKYEINSKKLKFTLVNNKFPIIINPKEVFNLIINIEKNYDYLLISNLPNRNRQNDKNKINKLVKLTLSTPVCLNIQSNKPINNLIWSFLFRWKDEFNNKLNITCKVENEENNLNNNNKIKLYHFFKVFFTISKIHKQKLRFEFRFKNSFDEFNLDKNLINIENKSNAGDGMPDIFPEKKSIEVEMKENELSKTIEVRYIPIRTEYIEIPPFEIFDSLLNKMYFVFFTNKIYVNQ
jgi:hypothetical protein